MTFKDILESLITESYTSNLTFSDIFLALCINLIISTGIFFIYQKHSQNEFYSKTFNISLPLMSIVTTGIILAMQSNLVISLGMVGALSIVRYRTAIKSPLDLFFLFWAISVGIICGAKQYILALIMSTFIALILSILTHLDLSSKKNILLIKCNKSQNLDALEKEIKKQAKFFELKSKQISESSAEIIFEFIPKKGTDISKILNNKKEIKEFRTISNN